MSSRLVWVHQNSRVEQTMQKCEPMAFCILQDNRPGPIFCIFSPKCGSFWKFEVLGYESLVLTNLVLAVFLSSAAGERRTTLIVAG